MSVDTAQQPTRLVKAVITAVMPALPGSQILLYPAMWVLMPAKAPTGMPPVKPASTL